MLFGLVAFSYWLATASGFSIEGPSQAKIDCHDNGDGSALITYLPTEAGEYAIHILCDEEDIHLSPWMSIIKPAPVTDFDPTKVENMKSLIIHITYYYECHRYVSFLL